MHLKDTYYFLIFSFAFEHFKFDLYLTDTFVAHLFVSEIEVLKTFASTTIAKYQRDISTTFAFGCCFMLCILEILLHLA